MKHKFPGEDEDWGWHTLGFLPHGVLQRLKVEFVTIVFFNAFDDVEGARELLTQVLSEASWQATGDRMLAELMEWRTQMNPKVRRMQKSRCQQMSETLAVRHDTDSSRAAIEFEDIIKNDPFHALEVAKRKCKMLKKSTSGTTRAEKEAASLAKYRQLLVQLCRRQACLCVVTLISYMIQTEHGVGCLVHVDPIHFVIV